MPDRSHEREEIESILKERILLIDGATGTMIQALAPTADDFGGEELDGCNEALVLNAPAFVERIHREYLEAGADIIETNTFGAAPMVLEEYGLAGRAEEINETAASIAGRVAGEFEARDSRPRLVAGSMGPTTKALSLTGGATFDEMSESYSVQARALIRGGVDILLPETANDGLNIKAAICGIERAFEETGIRVPVAVSMTIETMGTTLSGQSVEAFYAQIEHIDPLYIGLNCGTGPEMMAGHLRSISEISTAPVAVVPNAGLPDEVGKYTLTPDRLAEIIGRYIEGGLVNLVGGCCGTTPDHIRALAGIVRDREPRVPVSGRFFHVSGVDYIRLREEERPYLVGERTNVVGSAKFRRLIGEKKYDEAAEVGRAQAARGAHVIDLCLAHPDLDERDEVEAFLPVLLKMVRLPIMIDSTDSRVVEDAMKLVQGRMIVNSVNLEEGRRRFDEVVPLLKRYGGAVVVGLIDEDKDEGMAVTLERKREIAERSYRILTEEYGLGPEDIIFDPLVFPVGTGDEKYRRSAPATIEGIRMVKDLFPGTRTILGISNVSFGLPPAGREVLNSVFLHHAVEAGLDLAIVNTERLARYSSIPDEERLLAEDLLFARKEDPISPFADHFRDKSGRSSAGGAEEEAPKAPEDRIRWCLIEGSKNGLLPAVDSLIEKGHKPLDIINGPLMEGMAEVGRLFGENKLIVAEVLRSAEVMKEAVGRLEPLMEKEESATLGKVLLATVKGDVHDIGKNLVNIIFSNNGFSVVDLGIKVPPERLIEAHRAESPSLIGLSGLLVRSAKQMVTTASDLAAAGITTPIIVGGAALSKTFTTSRIAPEYGGAVAYASDAMSGLAVAKAIAAGEYIAADLPVHKPPQRKPRPATGRLIPRVVPPRPPRFDRRILEIKAGEIFPWINLQMLIGRHMGMRGSIDRLIEKKDPRVMELLGLMKRLLDEYPFRPRALYKWFRADSTGDTVRIISGGGEEVLETFTFPRQEGGDRLCLADFVLPEGEEDHIAFFVTTAGDGIMEEAARLREAGEYLRSHALSALALETAEGLAELLHARIREEWGFPDPPHMTMKERFGVKYRGCRYSFGYPACPEIEDQAKLWRLLRPEEIGVRLTEGYMMEPEASVSAMVLHHPEADYFSVL